MRSAAASSLKRLLNTLSILDVSKRSLYSTNRRAVWHKNLGIAYVNTNDWVLGQSHLMEALRLLEFAGPTTRKELQAALLRQGRQQQKYWSRRNEGYVRPRSAHDACTALVLTRRASNTPYSLGRSPGIPLPLCCSRTSEVKDPREIPRIRMLCEILASLHDALMYTGQVDMVRRPCAGHRRADARGPLAGRDGPRWCAAWQTLTLTSWVRSWCRIPRMGQAHWAVLTRLNLCESLGEPMCVRFGLHFGQAEGAAALSFFLGYARPLRLSLLRIDWAARACTNCVADRSAVGSCRTWDRGHRGKTTLANDYFVRAESISRRSEDPEDLTSIYLARAIAQFAAGEARQTYRSLETFNAVAEVAGYTPRRPDADLFFSVVSLLSGRMAHSFDRAKRCYDDASDHGEVRALGFAGRTGEPMAGRGGPGGGGREGGTRGTVGRTWTRFRKDGADASSCAY